MERPLLSFQKMTTEQKQSYVTESLDSLTSDILDLLCRIIAYYESGLE
jgi:hypothetical protein